MIADLQTPYYRYRKSNRTSQQRVKHVHIPPRRLDDLELARLQELLSIYEAKPKAWQANIDTEMNQNTSPVANKEGSAQFVDNMAENEENKKLKLIEQQLECSMCEYKCNQFIHLTQHLTNIHDTPMWLLQKNNEKIQGISKEHRAYSHAQQATLTTRRRWFEYDDVSNLCIYMCVCP